MNKMKLNSNALLDVPIRLCCGKQHLGPICQDGKVMCCLCFNRFEQDELNVMANGQKENVCKKCAKMENAANVKNKEIEVKAN